MPRRARVAISAARLMSSGAGDPPELELLMQVQRAYGMLPGRGLSPSAVESIGGPDILKKILGRYLVAFDGHCAMCDQAVAAVMKADRMKLLLFSPNSDGRCGHLVSTLGHLRGSQAVPAGWFDARKGGSMIVMCPSGEVLVESDAAIAIGVAVGGAHPLHVLARLSQLLIPRQVRDAGYRIVAQHRYSVFGKMEQCRRPTAAERDHFLY